MTTDEQSFDDDDVSDTTVFINPVTSTYVYDHGSDIELVIVEPAVEQIIGCFDPVFDIVAYRELELGCPLALH